jgi:phage terminase large subunit GpA-like protein
MPTSKKLSFNRPAQVGKTETNLSCLGYCIDQHPGPALVLPRDEDASKPKSAHTTYGSPPL